VLVSLVLGASPYTNTDIRGPKVDASRRSAEDGSGNSDDVVAFKLRVLVEYGLRPVGPTILWTASQSVDTWRVHRIGPLAILWIGFITG